MFRTFRRTAALAALTAGLAVAASGCAVQSNGSPESPASAPVVAVLVQPGAASAAFAAQRASAYRIVSAGATTLGSRLVVDALSAASASSDLFNAVMVGSGPNDLFRQQDLSHKTHGATSALARLASGPVDQRDDVITALTVLNNQLATVEHGPVDVALIGSLASASPLPGGGLLPTSNPATTINALAQKGLNFSCRGWRVAAVEPGVGPDGQPLSATANASLEAFWREYFAHCGGVLVAWTGSLLTFPVNGELSAPDTSLMAVQRSAGAVRVTLRSDLTFALGSAALQHGAAAELAGLKPLLAIARGTVAITGYTDSTGTPAVNDPLSVARANTIASWIESNGGIAAGQVRSTGRGDSDPVATNATSAGRARNRRVVIVIPTS